MGDKELSTGMERSLPLLPFMVNVGNLIRSVSYFLSETGASL